MPGPLVATCFFEQPFTKSGWTEVYAMRASLYPDAITAAATLMDARVAILTSQVDNTFVRISDITIRGDSFLTPGAGVGEWTGVGELEGSNPAWVALQLRQEAGFLNRSTRYLRALPDAQVKNGLFAPSPAFVTALDAYKAAIIAHCGILSRNATTGVYSILEISAVINSKLGWRKVGRPFGQPRGRRPISSSA